MTHQTLSGVKITHPDKILFSSPKRSKQALITYYQKIAPILLPHLNHYPLTLERYPEGVNQQGFFQKQAQDYFPDFVQSTNLTLVSKPGKTRYVLCQNKKTLLYLANLDVITLHRFLSKADKPHHPDKVIFDLDPSKDNDFKTIIDGAKLLKDSLEAFGLKPYVMTTGSRGLHVVAPIKRNHPFETVREFAKEVVEIILEEAPDDFTHEARKNKRGNKVYLDIARNAYGQTQVAPYTVRALKKAPIATPLRWAELDQKNMSPQKYTLDNIFKRLSHMADPWKHMQRHARKLDR